MRHRSAYHLTITCTALDRLYDVVDKGSIDVRVWVLSGFEMLDYDVDYQTFHFLSAAEVEL